MGSPLLSHFQAQGRVTPTRFFICFGPLLSFARDHHTGPNYVFPSLTDDTHIMGPMNEIT